MSSQNDIYIKIDIAANYPFPELPGSMAQALTESIEAHLKAYGFKDVAILLGPFRGHLNA